MQFSQPCQVVCIGSSGSGKTTLIKAIIENQQKYFQDPIDNVFWFYGVENEQIPKGPNIFSYEGVPDLQMLKEMKGKKNILVLDDLQFFLNSSAKNRQLLNNLFCLYAHHYNLALFTLFHNIFDVSRSARLSATHYLLLNTNNERVQIRNLLGQLFPYNQLRSAVNCYEDCMKEPYQHLLINNSIGSDPKLRLMSRITEENPIIYQLRE